MNKKLLSLVALTFAALPLYAMEPEAETLAAQNAAEGFTRLLTNPETRASSMALVPATLTAPLSEAPEASLRLLRQYESPAALNAIEMYGIKASTNRVNAKNKTLFQEAFKADCADIVSTLVAQNPTLLNPADLTRVAQKGLCKIGLLFYAKHAQLFNLGLAATLDSPHIAQRCLENGEDVNGLYNLTTKVGQTYLSSLKPLALVRSAAMAKFLVENGAKFNVAGYRVSYTNNNHSILHVLKQRNQTDAANYLVSLGAKLTEFDNQFPSHY